MTTIATIAAASACGLGTEVGQSTARNSLRGTRTNEARKDAVRESRAASWCGKRPELLATPKVQVSRRHGFRCTRHSMKVRGLAGHLAAGRRHEIQLPLRSVARLHLWSRLQQHTPVDQEHRLRSW